MRAISRRLCTGAVITIIAAGIIIGGTAIMDGIIVTMVGTIAIMDGVITITAAGFDAMHAPT
jgi:hypothetical protein